MAYKLNFVQKAIIEAIILIQQQRGSDAKIVYSELADRIDVSVNTVQRHITHLVKLGVVTREKVTSYKSTGWWFIYNVQVEPESLHLVQM